MKIGIIGTGFVGLTQGAVFADVGHEVVCIDCLEDKIASLKKFCSGKSKKFPIYEPRLPELVKKNYEKGLLTFTTNLEEAVKGSSILFIAVGTPEGADGRADLSAVKRVAQQIGQAMNYKSEEEVYKIIVNKSTVPVGTAQLVKEIIKKETANKFDVVSNPEFLAEGRAVEDSLRPSRIVIGTDSQKATKIMREIYAPFVEQGHPIYSMSNVDAEIVKYSSNTYLGLQIVLTNMFANLSREVGGDWSKIKKAITADARIGKFVHGGLGFGGSCFGKDIEQFIYTLKDNKIDVKLLEEALKQNKNQKTVFMPRILEYFGYSIKGKTFAIWGLSFKPETSDMRDAASIPLIEMLIGEGAKIKAYDPAAMEEAKKVFSGRSQIEDNLTYCKENYKALDGCDALIITAEWNEFKQPDFKKIKKKLKNPVIFDGKDIYQLEEMKRLGFDYFSIGRADVKK
ncbi:UDP-glucose/GDP-mannose dehydrogenase family protein [Candidatus Woesearchaeota archaeon]|nr:UDP-glucose/GDP-mannose dehydrogenase family protein [Candidatus Woesearchaeota archaeon]